MAVLSAQQPDESPSIRKLREQVSGQELQIQQQQHEIESLHTALVEQKRQMQEALKEMGAAPAPTPAVAASGAKTPSPPAVVPPPETEKAASTKPSVGAQPNAGAQRAAELPLNASQEVRFSNTSPALKLGPADIRLQGYIALAGLYDSANVGGSIGTNFAGIPFSNTPEGNASEFRLSTQRTRVAVRVDTKLRKADLTSYLEADFRGTTSGTVAVTSSSFGFRVRQAWIDYNVGRFQFSAGQMFSLITPVRSEVTPNPAQSMMTYAVDAQYLAGLVWDRAPALRFAFRPNRSTTLAVALENPEQQVGSVVKFPSALASTLSTQYNTGTAELRTPNLGPDTIVKASFNFGQPGHQLHVDTGAVLRFFRSYNPSNISGHKNAVGIGGNLNIGLDLTRQLHLVLNGFVSSGGGRYIGGLSPDVIVRANGDISPVKAHSWVTGLEWAPSRRNTLFAYYSGVYTGRNLALDTDRTVVGYGFPGSTAARRIISEYTAGWARLFWNSESAGSIQLNTQYSFIENMPWFAGSGPSRAHANLVFGQVRYNLP